MPDGFWAVVTIYLLVGPIGTLFVPVAHEAVVDAAAVVLAAEMNVLLAILWRALYIRQVGTVSDFFTIICKITRSGQKWHQTFKILKVLLRYGLSQAKGCMKRILSAGIILSRIFFCVRWHKTRVQLTKGLDISP